jgi:hypothetical protein
MNEWDSAREWLKLAAWHNAIKSEMHVRAIAKALNELEGQP